MHLVGGKPVWKTVKISLKFNSSYLVQGSPFYLRFFVRKVSYKNRLRSKQQCLCGFTIIFPCTRNDYIVTAEARKL